MSQFFRGAWQIPILRRVYVTAGDMSRLGIAAYVLSSSVGVAYGATQSKGLGPPMGQRYAIVVGVAAYPPESRLRTLRWPTDDAKLLSQALNSLGFIGPPPLLDARATRTGIRASIVAIAGALDPSTRQSTTIVMYFSGHGFAENSTDGLIHNYLATYESDGKDLKASGLSVDDLNRWLKATGAGRIMLVLDACRNSPSGGKSAVDSSWAPFDASDGIRILLSTGVGDYSWEDDSLQHGVFSKFMIAGLQGAARDASGNLTASSLFD